MEFKREDSAKTMAHASAIQVGKDQSIDPNLLFQCLLVLSQTTELSLEGAMAYETSPYPLYSVKEKLCVYQIRQLLALQYRSMLKNHQLTVYHPSTPKQPPLSWIGDL